MSVQRTKQWRIFPAAGLVLGLVACGGGGGGAGDPVDPGPVAGPLAITAGNYEAVARQTSVATSYLLDTGGLVTGAQTAPSAGTLIAFSRAQLARVPALFRRATPVVGGASVDDVWECSGGGSVTATLDDRNGNGEADNGESATLVARNCVEQGATLNGNVAMAFSNMSGNLDGDVFTATVAITLTGLRAVSAAGDVTGNGSMTLAITGTGVDRVRLDMQVPLLTTSGTVGGVADAMTLQNWRITSSTAPGNGGPVSSTSASGSTTSSALGGRSVSVATDQPLVVLWGDAYASSGQVTATGAASSQVRLTALNASTVRLSLDADGNGVFETSVDRPWSTLD